MKRLLDGILLLSLLTVVVTTMTGCTFGRARIGITVNPDPLLIDFNKSEIEGTVTLTLDGLGSFTVDEIGLDYIDAQGQRIEGEGLPQGGKLTQSISLVGTMGVVRKTLPLKGVLGAEGVKIRNEWWLPGALHPASCRMTLLDISGRVVGAGSVGLKWHPY